jgi:acetamidase/formamidase
VRCDLDVSIHHRLDAPPTEAFWDNAVPPRITARSGEVVEFEIVDASDGQIAPGVAAETLTNLDFGRINLLTGPVAIEGAEPGDTLQVDVLGFESKGWGWTGEIPGFGLLAEDFPEPYLKTWELGKDTAEFAPGIVIPLEPFCGVIGVAPRDPGQLNTIPPRENAGNVDIRQLIAGSTVYLPVFIPGALVSLGDSHAAQGDGEVCGTAIEAPYTVRVRLTVRKDLHVRELQYEAPARANRTAATFNTTAHSPDLMEAAKQATRYMIDHLHETKGLTRAEAYALCSVAVDLRISEVVDQPNWVVSASLSLDIFV